MNCSKKIISLIISMVLFMLLPTVTWAAEVDGVEYSAVIDTPEINVSDEEQTIVITVQTDEVIDIDGFEGKITLPTGFEIVDITSGDEAILDVYYNDETLYFLSDNIDDDANNMSGTDILVITCTVPANAEASTYTTTIWFDELTCDYGTVFAKNITVTATVKIVEVEEGLKGDVNLDGDVTAEDAASIMKHLARMNIIEDETALRNADVTGDEEVTAEDAAKIMKYLARMIDTLD